MYNWGIKKKLIVKPLILIAVSLVVALFIITFIPYQLSKISSLNGQPINFPPILGYCIVFAFIFRPILLLIENIILLKRFESGENPSCPQCSYPMVRRLAKKGKYTGQEFWGCLEYPKCNGKIHIG